MFPLTWPLEAKIPDSGLQMLTSAETYFPQSLSEESLMDYSF